MSENTKLVDLQKRRKEIENGGGADNIKTQQQAGRMTARERLSMLFDEGTFIEIGAFVKQRPTEFDSEGIDLPEGVVTGYGAIDGRLAFAYAQDATVLGGALGEMQAKKIAKVMDLAVKNGAPIISLFDSNGIKLKEGVDALYGYSDIIKKAVDASGVIPQISVVAGLCAGGFALIAAQSDFVIMTDDAQMFLTAPVVLKAAFGEDVTDVANAKGNEQSGNAHLLCANDKEAVALAKLLITYFPDNNLDTAPIVENGDDIDRISVNLNSVIGEGATDMRAIIAELADVDSFIESQVGYGVNMITGLARMGGESVGFVANNGALCSVGASKAARFIQLCDSFNIPLVTLIDVPGFAMSAAEEKSASSRAISRMVSAYASATCPKVSVVVKKAYGSAFVSMNAGNDITFAWPTAEIGCLEPSAAATILYNDEIAASSDPIAKRAELSEKYRTVVSSPYEAAKRGYVDDIIEPSSTRPRVIASLFMLEGKRENGPAKKHGNMPL